jgi:arylsulfatase B
VGKWHLGGTARFHPQRRGFDEFFGFLHEGPSFVPPPWKDHVTWLRRKALPDGTQGRWTSPDGRTVWSTYMGTFEPDYDADNPILRGSQPVDEQSNLTDAFTREAESFIDRHRAQPFCLLLAYNAVHSPLQGPDVYMNKFAHIKDVQRRIFAAMLAHLDDGVGRVLEKLRDRGLEKQTLVVFLSDNGGPTRELTSSNLPLRGEKGQLLEGGIRVPFLMRWKDQLPAGLVERRPVISLDIAATVLAAAGSRRPPSPDGVNLVPRLTATDTGVIHSRLFWRLGPQAALREGDWKIHRGRGDESWQLFDLVKDPGESNNLAGDQPDRLAKLEALWKALNAEMVAPLWGGAPRIGESK